MEFRALFSCEYGVVNAGRVTRDAWIFGREWHQNAIDIARDHTFTPPITCNHQPTPLYIGAIVCSTLA